MAVEIKRLEETSFSFAEVHTLIKKVYSTRAEEGIHFWALNASTDEVLNRVNENGGITMLATDNEHIIGTATALFHNDKFDWAGFILAAVSPEYQGQGIGKKLYAQLQTIAHEKRCRYIMASTALNAISSVKWHLANGFLPYSLNSYANTDYYSILFRKYLPVTTIAQVVMCKVNYTFSSFISRVLWKHDGKETQIGKLIKSLRRK